MDEEDRYWMRPTISLNALAVTKPPSATNESTFDRPSWITQRARRVLGSYRKDDFADPDVFLITLGQVLEKYPDGVIREATDAFTGIQAQCKFPPSIAEVKELCDELKRRSTFVADWDRQTQKQFAEREGIEREPLEQRLAVADRILREYHQKIGSVRYAALDYAKHVLDLKEKYGVTDEQWNTIPDANAR